MACSGGKITKKRIIILLALVTGVAAILYGASVATENFTILALSPLVFGLIACPLMCGVMGGGMWLMSRLSKNKEKSSRLSKNDSRCCQHDHNHTVEDHRENERASNDTRESIKHMANNAPGDNDDSSRDPNTLRPKSNSKFKIFPN